MAVKSCIAKTYGEFIVLGAQFHGEPFGAGGIDAEACADMPIVELWVAFQPLYQSFEKRYHRTRAVHVRM